MSPGDLVFWVTEPPKQNFDDSKDEKRDSVFINGYMKMEQYHATNSKK